MKILIGLGNPGEKYKDTRHNIGFTIIEEIAKTFAQSKWIGKFNSSYCQCWSQKKKFILLKPQTFMNNSGQAIEAVTSFYKIANKDLVVIHDDLDLEIGCIKLKRFGGHAGHNGLRSIHQKIGDSYTRLRIGIGRPEKKIDISSYVLSNFTKPQNKYVDYYKRCVVAGLVALLSDDHNTFMSSINSTFGQKDRNPEKPQPKYGQEQTEKKLEEDASLDNQNRNFLHALLKKFN